MSQFYVLTLIGALIFASIGLSSPMMSLYLEGLGANYSLISAILTSYTATALVFNYAWGRISDVVNRRKAFLVAGTAGLALSSLLLSAVPSVQMAWLVRLLEGASMAAYGTISLALMGDILEREDGISQGRKGRRMGLYRGLASLAFAVAAVFGGRIADAFGIRVVFAACAVVYLLACLAALAVQEPPRDRVTLPSPRREPRGRIFRIPRLNTSGLPLLFLSGVLLWNMAHYASTSMWSNYMASLGYSKSALSTLWGFAAFIEMPSMFVAGALSDITGRAMTLALGAGGIGLVNLGYLTLAAVLPALIVIQVLRGFGYGSYTASAMVFAAESGDTHARGRASSDFHAAGSLGQLAGTLIAGNLVQVLGFSALFLACGIVALIGSACFVALASRHGTEPR